MTNPQPSPIDEVRGRPPGHCDDDGSWAQFVGQYAGQERSYSDMTDFALANAVFMADRGDLDLIVYQTAAKERIRWLSIRLAESLAHDTARDEEVERLKAIILDLAPPFRKSGTCWCTSSRDVSLIGHTATCLAIRTALSPSPSTGEGS